MSSDINLNECLIEFFDIYKEATKKNFSQIRVSENTDQNWYEIRFENGLTIREWIEYQTDLDYKVRLKFLITSTSTPVFSKSEIEEKFRYDLSEFRLNSLEVPILGATYLLGQLSFSFNTSIIWRISEFELIHNQLNQSEGGETEIQEAVIHVPNVTSLSHWVGHYENIRDYRLSIARDPEKRFELLDSLANIEVLGVAKKQIKKIESQFFNELFDNLEVIQDVINNLSGQPLTYQYLINNCPRLNISDESDTVKQNFRYASSRTFMYDGDRHFFGFHIKSFSNSNRVHFLIDNESLVIGYVGKHLPLPTK